MERMRPYKRRRKNPACPRCGSGQTYYRKFVKSWRCVSCDKNFRVRKNGKSDP